MKKAATGRCIKARNIGPLATNFRINKIEAKPETSSTYAHRPRTNSKFIRKNSKRTKTDQKDKILTQNMIIPKSQIFNKSVRKEEFLKSVTPSTIEESKSIKQPKSKLNFAIKNSQPISECCAIIGWE